MTNWRKHINLRKIKYFNLTILLLFVAIACKEKQNVKLAKPIASVDNVNLTIELFEKLKAFRGNSTKDSSEIVNEWIEEQVFFNEAKNRGLIGNEQFKTAGFKQSRELAKAILFENIMKNLKVEVYDDEIANYYENNKSEFLLNETAYIIDEASFDNLQSALKFREFAIKKNWDFAKSIVNGKFELNKFQTESSAPNKKIIRALRIIPYGEISPVLKAQNKFIIFVKKKSLKPNDFLPINQVKAEIRERIILEKKVREFNKAKKEIFTNHKIEVFGVLNE